MKPHQHPLLEHGYSIVNLRKLELSNLPWRAAYGLMLMRACREADIASDKLGYFVQHIVPTEEEFRAMRKVFWRAKK